MTKKRILVIALAAVLSSRAKLLNSIDNILSNLKAEQCLYFQTFLRVMLVNSGVRTLCAFRLDGDATATKIASTAPTKTTARLSLVLKTSSAVHR